MTAVKMDGHSTSLSTINFEQYADLFESDFEDEDRPNFDLSEDNRFEALTSEDILGFIEKQGNSNTKKKTASDIKLFISFLSRNNEHRQPQDLEPSQLADFVSRFLLSVRKKDGSEYEPSSLRGFYSSLDRYLRQHSYPNSLINDQKFSLCREALKSKQKQLKSMGKGNKPRAADELTDDDICKLYENGQLGTHSPQALVNTMWLINMLYFGMRGGAEQHQLKWGDIRLQTDEGGNQYLIYTQERQTKTRTGENPRDVRKVKPRAYATPEQPDRDPVAAHIEYSKRRPQSLTGPDDAFFLSVNEKSPAVGQAWFKRQNMGINKIYSIMKAMKTNANISSDKRLTNHSARKHLIQKLNDNNVPPNQIIQISGHRNLNSVNNYSNLNTQQQAKISNILSNSVASTSLVPLEPPSSQSCRATSVQTIQPSQQTTTNTSRQYSLADTRAFFQGSTFNNSVINVYCHPPPSEHSTPSKPKYRRILPLPEEDSD